LAERLAEELIALKDGYRTTIRYVGDYQIKHSQTITLYSAFSRVRKSSPTNENGGSVL
jgi:hypothetical protein